MSTNLEWDNEDSLRLLDLYEKQAVLWNPRHSNYYNKGMKQKGWKAVAKACGVPVAEVKRKMDSLLSSFRRERCKVRKMQAADDGGRPEYVSRWFAFKKMSFLLDKEEPKEFLDYDDVSLRDDPDHIANDSIQTDEDGPLFNVEAVYNSDLTSQVDLEESSGASNPPQPKPREPERSMNFKAIVPFKKLKAAKRCASDSEDDSRNDINEAIDLLKSAATVNGTLRDGSSVYGEHIANKLRGYGKRTRAIVEHQINNILFQADMGEIENPMKFSIQSTGSMISNQREAVGSVDSSSGLPPSS